MILLQLDFAYLFADMIIIDFLAPVATSGNESIVYV